MRWAVFGIFAYLTLVLDTSLLELLAGRELQIKPSACGLLAAFICLSAPRMAAMWACLTLGLLLDLSDPLSLGEADKLHLIGPRTLGYVCGGYLVLQLRTIVFRQRALTIGTMTFICLLAVHLVAVAVYVIRSWYPGGDLSWAQTTTLGELLRRFLMALYSGLLAIPFGWLLVRSMPLWGFQTLSHRSGALR